MIHCSQCNKDITRLKYKMEYYDAPYCWWCYRKIPYNDRIQAIKERNAK